MITINEATAIEIDKSVSFFNDLNSSFASNTNGALKTKTINIIAHNTPEGIK